MKPEHQRVDHEIKVGLTSVEYVAVRHLAAEDDRSMSSYVRRLIRADMDKACQQMRSNDSEDSGQEREGP